MEENNNNQQTEQCNSHIRLKFLTWVAEYNPDNVSRTVLASLLHKYENGNKEPLFYKYKQLIEHEHYALALIFRDCFIYLCINNEFKAFVNYA